MESRPPERPRDTPEQASSTDAELSWDAPPASIDEFAERLRQVGYGDLVDEFVALVRPSLRLVPDPSVIDPEAAELRLGGRPVLPNGCHWPRRASGAPLSFVAHITLERVAILDADVPFPAHGSLAFFCDPLDLMWGFSPSDADGWAVIHCPTGAGTLRDFPDDMQPERRFRPVALNTQRELTFPPPESFDVEQITGEQFSKAYLPILAWGMADTTHRFMGQPDPFQGDMQAHCQMASHGVYFTDHNSPERLRLKPGAAEWRLLLQVDSDDPERTDGPGMMWGDVGRIYWWIREADLAEGRWDAAWLVAQF